MKKPKTLDVAVIQANGCRVALFQGHVFQINDGMGRCGDCPFDKWCKRREKDADTYTAPCSMLGLDEVNFTELFPKQ